LQQLRKSTENKEIRSSTGFCLFELERH